MSRERAAGYNCLRPRRAAIPTLPILAKDEFLGRVERRASIRFIDLTTRAE
jgi:hypothetical protein